MNKRQPLPKALERLQKIALKNAQKDVAFQVAKKASLDKFGEFFVRNLRDKMLYSLEGLLRGKWKAPSAQKLQKRIGTLTKSQQKIVRDVVDDLIISGMHGLLFAIQEESDSDGSIRVFVDGDDVGKMSDGLHGEIFCEDGWIARFSEYPGKSNLP